MISIVISEKGGAERHEHHELSEVTIGRVKGNDILLPKGNVSKRHARLIVRDGRYIVTDLKSTNGTYVNHRRITHATLVREGDRIYIGDFVLRIEGDAGMKESGSERPSQLDLGPESSTSSSSGRVPAAMPAPATSAPPHTADIVSHFPIEQDPDESSPSLQVPAPPLVPTGFASASPGSVPATRNTIEPSFASDRSAIGSSPGALGTPAFGSEPLTPQGLSSHQAEAERRARAAHQEVLDHVVGEVESKVGVERLAVTEVAETLASELDTALDTALEAATAAGRLPSGVDRDAVRSDALLELLALGPLESLLEDANITQVQVLARQVVVHRRNRPVDHSGANFATESGVARALSRLCARSGIELSPEQTFVEVALSGGRELFAALPPASSGGHLLVVRQPRQEVTSIDGLVRAGAISRGMASLLVHCVAARANILVTGSPDGGSEELISALAVAAQRHHQVIWLYRGESEPKQTPGIDLGTEPAARREAITAAARLRADHLVVPPLGGEDLAVVLDRVIEGVSGLLMRANASTLRHAVGRMSAELASARPGLSPSTAQEWLHATFDIGLEVTRLRDGRLRVVRLVEFHPTPHLGGMVDIFSFAYHRTAAGGSVEGSFYASGTIPRIVEDLAARGMPLDTAIFRRQQGV